MQKRWAVAFCIAMLAAPLGATTLVRMSLKRLASAATAIVRARCLGSFSDWEAGEIWTRTRFETLETFKGSPSAQFTVRLIGGQVGGIESIVGEVPRFRPGEEVVLFLDPSKGGSFAVTAWAEGTFRVSRGRSGKAFVTEESSGEAVYDRATRKFLIEGIRKMPLGVFRQQIRSLTRSQSAGELRGRTDAQRGAER